jgi:hypothetical protein
MGVEEVPQRVHVAEDVPAHRAAHLVAFAAAEGHRGGVREVERLVTVDLRVLDRRRVAQDPVLGGDVDLGVETLEELEDLVVSLHSHGEDVQAHPAFSAEAHHVFRSLRADVPMAVRELAVDVEVGLSHHHRAAEAVAVPSEGHAIEPQAIVGRIRAHLEQFEPGRVARHHSGAHGRSCHDHHRVGGRRLVKRVAIGKDGLLQVAVRQLVEEVRFADRRAQEDLALGGLLGRPPDHGDEAAAHDPRRVLAGTLTPMLTWGVLGLLTGGVVSLLVSGALGAVWGALITYYALHHVTKAQFTRLGSQLPPDSSALLTYAETDDPRVLLRAAAARAPSVASVASVNENLTTRVLPEPAGAAAHAPAGAGSESDALNKTTGLRSILLRYPDPAIAKQLASRLKAATAASDAPDVELIIETNADRHRRVVDPRFGSWPIARSNVVSWGGFGVVCGAVSGAAGGGAVGALGGGLLAGIASGLFGLAAGALYGLWAGRAISARRLRGIGNPLGPGTSALVVWVEGALSGQAVDTLVTPGSRWLVLSVDPTGIGAVLTAA